MKSISVLDRPLRILHLEDNPDDRHMVQEWLTQQNIAVEFIDVDNESSFVDALKNEHFDIVLSDITLPGFSGLGALRLVQEQCPEIPFVFVTGSIGEEAAIDTMKEGATDYVLKDRLSRLIPAVQRAIQESERAEKSRQFEENNRQQAALLDKAQDAILVKDMDDRIQYWNKSAERIYGWSAPEMIGRKAGAVLIKDPGSYEEAKRRLLEIGDWKGELLKMNRGGNELIIDSHWTLVRDDAGKPKCIFAIDTDITEKKSIEARFLRSQRMDSIGALAGGIAHDLNNALAPVIMGAELLRECEDRSTRDQYLDVICSNAQRATNLVKQILSFARGSRRQKKPVQVRHLITEMGKMIQDTFPKSISLSIKIRDKDLWTVQGDPTEIHQVLLNLCVNARDAMPKGGRLTISAENFIQGVPAATATATNPGSYVLISVADSGTGIPPEVLPRIFEPFFTTKSHDKGTGLGLATVAGILKRQGGFMDIHTENGKGTEFKIHFPACDAAEAAGEDVKKPALPAGHGEWIQLIDDEAALLELTKSLLEGFGYNVVTARDGLQGVARFKEHQDKIKLVITDSDMPQLDGRGVISALQQLKPDLPIILASGYKGDTEELRRIDPLRLQTLKKPYTVDQLLLAVGAALKV